MASEIKVDTVSEKTSGSGVTIDGLLIKDGGISGDVSLIGTTPTFTIGDAGAEDAALIFDGNAQDFYIALDDSADDLIIGLGNTVGTTPMLSFDENKIATFADDIIIGDGKTIGSASDVDAITIASNGQLTLTQTLIGTALDISGNIDIDGTTNLDTVDIDGAVQLDSTLTIGVDDTGYDVKFFGATASSYLEWDESADDLNLIASGIGVTTAKDLGVGVHIRTADSGASVHSNADELVIENNGACGLSILSSTSTNGAIIFGDSGGNARGRLTYEHGNDDFAIDTAGAEVFRLTSDGQIGTRGETAPDVNNGGMTLNQGGDDGNIMSFKSSDVAHGITGNAETDTYAEIGKASGGEGGLLIQGYAEGDNDAFVLATCTVSAPPSANSTSAGACIRIDGAQKSGTGRGSIAAGDNILVVGNNDTTEFIIKGDGELYSNQSATVQTFDSYEDAQLVRALDLSRDKDLAGVINSKFDDYIKYNHETLANAKLVGREEDGTPNHFVNVTGMQRLHNGAIWQQYEKHERLLEAVYDLAKLAVGEEKANAILDKHEVKRLQ
jgi:hypothetical protein